MCAICNLLSASFNVIYIISYCTLLNHNILLHFIMFYCFIFFYFFCILFHTILHSILLCSSYRITLRHIIMCCAVVNHVKGYFILSFLLFFVTFCYFIL